ncbi:hypothetical protein SMD44_08523 [Streptomyces alboflavus]|uniref:Uncharacterized protein n=1 Tax=Streptomyces alboflavus TaxID=67267 RepID=A0A1Z1WRH6_9ACTN|nr:hypothetical protein [Streptomyces alboflavus]ARX89036.1 hypothetical protein SMD44_08523 [Streptomyces alboflavus]
MVREPVRAYGSAADNDDQKRLRRLFPFTSVRLLTLVTPDLLPPKPIPDLSTPGGDPNDKFAFFPVTLRTEDPFRFQVSMVDVDGRVLEFATPMAFVGKRVHENTADVGKIIQHYHGLIDDARRPEPLDLADADVRRVVADVRGQSVAYAPSHKPDDTTLPTGQFVWGAVTTRRSSPWTPPTTPGSCRRCAGRGPSSPRSASSPPAPAATGRSRCSIPSRTSQAPSPTRTRRSCSSSWPSPST